MDVRHIRQIMEITRQGSFGRAARELGMSQPALSRSVARLEDRLGATLFDRSGEGARPTVFADYIVARADGAMKSISALEHEVRLMARGEAGRLTIGIGPSPREIILPQLFARMIGLYPGLSLRTQNGGAVELVAQLVGRSIDIALASSEFVRGVDRDEDPDIVSTELFVASVGFFVRADHPILARRKAFSAAEILEYPIASLGLTPSQRSAFPAQLTRSERHNIGAYQVRDAELLRYVVKISDAIGFSSVHLWTRDVAEGRGVQLDIDFPTKKHSVVALTIRKSWHSPLVRKCVEIARELSAALDTEA